MADSSLRILGFLPFTIILMAALLPFVSAVLMPLAQR